MKLKPETTGFVRGGMLFLEPPHKWRVWQRDVWSCCSPVAAPAAMLRGWSCRVCGGRMLCVSEPNFCAYCRAARARLAAFPLTPRSKGNAR